MQVLQHISDGLNTKEIAAALYVTENSVKTFTRRLFARIGVKERSHAVRLGFDRGLLVVALPQPEPPELFDIELRLLGLIAQGLSYGRIAPRLGLASEEYVRHRSRVLCRELRARNRAHAVRRGYEFGFLWTAVAGARG